MNAKLKQTTIFTTKKVWNEENGRTKFRAID